MSYRRQYDPSQFIMPPRRPNYPLPPYRGTIFGPQPGQAGSLGLLPAPAPAPDEVGGGLMGYLGSGGEFDLDGSRAGEVGSVGGLSPGSKGGTAMGNDPSPGYSSLGSNLGQAASVATGVSGLGLGGAVVGSLADAYNMDQIAEQQGLPTLTVGQVARGVVADMVPFSQSLFGMPTHQDFYQQNYLDRIGGFLQPSNMYSSPENDPWGLEDPYGPSNSWDTDMANNDVVDPSAGWDTDIANSAGNFGGNEGQDDLSGPDSGDIDDEAAGENDMGQDAYRRGGLLGDDGDGLFEPVRKTLHENEAVLKPESVEFFGEKIVMQMNNVASLKPAQKKKLAAAVSAQILSGKPATKKTDFRASR